VKKLIVFMTTGYCGEEAADALSVPENFTEEEINDIAWEMAVDNAESYGRELEPDDDPEDEVDYAYPDFSVHKYDPEKHDMYRVGGGSFEEDFK
jgi:hypothetical protein